MYGSRTGRASPHLYDLRPGSCAVLNTGRPTTSRATPPRVCAASATRGTTRSVVQQLHLTFLEARTTRSWIWCGLRTLPRISPFTRPCVRGGSATSSAGTTSGSCCTTSCRESPTRPWSPRIWCSKTAERPTCSTRGAVHPGRVLRGRLSARAQPWVRGIRLQPGVQRPAAGRAALSGTLRGCCPVQSGVLLGGDHVPTPSDWIIDWTRFFVSDRARGSRPNLSRRIPRPAADLRSGHPTRGFLKTRPARITGPPPAICSAATTFGTVRPGRTWPTP